MEFNTEENSSTFTTHEKSVSEQSYANVPPHRTRLLPEKTITLRAAIYARVSTQEQANRKTSIPDQLEACHKIVKEKGWKFMEEYKDEAVSGHLTEERNGLQSMLRDARQHKFDRSEEHTSELQSLA